MKWAAFLLGISFVTGCISSPHPHKTHALSPDDYQLNSRYNPETRLIEFEFTSNNRTICINPDNWPFNGLFGSPEHLPIVTRDKEVFQLNTYALDNGMGMELRVQPGETLSGFVNLSDFNGLQMWTGRENVQFLPQLYAC